MARRKKTIHQRIMRANKAGTGMYLTPGDVWILANMDDAIRACAEMDDETDEEERSAAKANL